MKKIKNLSFFLIFSIFLSLSACSDEKSQNSVRKEASSASVEIDHDFTKLSATMIFGLVFEMMMDPKKYLDKTFKIEGEHESTYIEQIAKDLRYIVIYDALGCCPQGIEMELPNEDFVPEASQKITVLARLKKKEGDYPRYYLDVFSIKAR